MRCGSRTAGGPPTHLPVLCRSTGGGLQPVRWPAFGQAVPTKPMLGLGLPYAARFDGHRWRRVWTGHGWTTRTLPRMRQRREAGVPVRSGRASRRQPVDDRGVPLPVPGCQPSQPSGILLAHWNGRTWVRVLESSRYEVPSPEPASDQRRLSGERQRADPDPRHKLGVGDRRHPAGRRDQYRRDLQVRPVARLWRAAIRRKLDNDENARQNIPLQGTRPRGRPATWTRSPR